MASFLSSLFASSGTALAAEAVKEMPAIVAAVYSQVKGVLSPAPTSSAEVGVAAAILKAIPTLTSAQLTSIKTIYGQALAEWQTQNAGQSADNPANAAAIQSLADAGVSSQLGLDTSKIPAIVKLQLLTSAIVVSDAGMGVAPLNVTKA